jgi:hypothetical protein
MNLSERRRKFFCALFVRAFVRAAFLLPIGSQLCWHVSVLDFNATLQYEKANLFNVYSFLFESNSQHSFFPFQSLFASEKVKKFKSFFRLPISRCGR